MSESKDLPVIEIIFLTGVPKEEFEVKNLPILNVSYNEEQQLYLILNGIEVIENALAKCFQTLNQPSALTLILAVNLTSNS